MGLFITYTFCWLMTRSALKDNTKMQSVNVLSFFVTAVCLFIMACRYTAAGYGFGFHNGICFVFSMMFAYKDAVEETEIEGCLAPSLGVNLLFAIAIFILFFL